MSVSISFNASSGEGLSLNRQRSVQPTEKRLVIALLIIGTLATSLIAVGAGFGSSIVAPVALSSTLAIIAGLVGIVAIKLFLSTLFCGIFYFFTRNQQ